MLTRSEEIQRKEHAVNDSPTAAALRGLRLKTQKTRTRVAADLGFSYNALMSYESGTRTPSDERKKKIAGYYGKSVQEIFYDTTAGA